MFTTSIADENDFAFVAKVFSLNMANSFMESNTEGNGFDV